MCMRSQLDREVGSLRVWISVTNAEIDSQTSLRSMPCSGSNGANQTVPRAGASRFAQRPTNTLVACSALWSLQRFKNHADTIIPALKKAAQREDIVGGWAKSALKPVESEADAKPVR